MGCSAFSEEETPVNQMADHICVKPTTLAFNIWNLEMADEKEEMHEYGIRG